MTVFSLFATLCLFGFAWIFAICFTKKNVRATKHASTRAVDESFRTFVQGEVATHLPEYVFDDDYLERELMEK